MTLDEAISYIEKTDWSSTRLGLERTRELLDKLNNPQKKLKFIHVAGSNGKGSTCAMLDAILRAAGYRTGLYTSPHIQCLEERIRVNGENIPAEKLVSITERIRTVADAMEDHPSQFELITAIAMEYFLECGCDIVVLEVGMGGALDSTNVIDAPEVAVLTNIGLEHTEFLGSTLTEIASTKAGIIKHGCHCVCYDGELAVTELIKSICREQNVPFTLSQAKDIKKISESLDGQVFEWRGSSYFLALNGIHQLKNAAVVLNVIEILRCRGWDLPDEAVHEGLRTVCWPARMEVLCHSPLFILDGGHNVQCTKALTESLSVLLPNQKAIFLIGMLEDKDYLQMLEMLKPLASSFICVTPDSPRALSSEILATHLTKMGCCAVAYESIAAGIKAALDAAREDGVIICFGSLYIAGKVRTAFKQEYRTWLRKQKIARRNGLDAMDRCNKSETICQKLLASSVYQNAKTVMLYKYVKGEVQLTTLEEANLNAPDDEKKNLIYPLCIENREMLAILPGSPDTTSSAWKKGAYGICEPDESHGSLIAPEKIDLVICPCSSFDSQGHRLGMGGGYYDRFLPQCKNATAIAVAFEAQKSDELPVEPWDIPVDIIFTESTEILDVDIEDWK